jgi:O-succinylbenzoic acid--CoA ligase
MENVLTYLQQRADDNWLIGHDSHSFYQLSEQLFLELTQGTNRKISPKVLIADPNPLRFLAAFLAAIAADCPVFLGNPNWVQQEWQQVFEYVQPDLIFGQEAHSFVPFPSSFPLSLSQAGRIMIPTGGSSGKIRFAIHTWQTLMASVGGFYQYFGQNPVNSFCVLPLYHVSGLMQFLRSFTTGGRLIIKSFKELEVDGNFYSNPSEFFISLVPTQLQRCLQKPKLSHWLSRFRTVLLGGAPAWESLLEQTRHHNIPLSLTYGMTETASQVVTLKPDDFLAGNTSCGQVLPHARVTICSPIGEILGTNKTGIITIQADSLALGYYSQERWDDGKTLLNPKSKIQNLKSDDLGFFDDRGYLNVVGRSSNKIITGGENVFPSEVEAAIQSTQLVTDVCVTGVPDLHWGQVVTAVYVPRLQGVSPALLQTTLEDKLSKYKRPKYWIPVEDLPRNDRGKVNSEQLKRIVMTWLESQNTLSRQLE